MRNLMSVVALAAAVSFAAAAAPITDEESAIAEARKYTKGRCPAATPCNFKPRREGKQWNVWVEFTKRHAPGEKPRPYHGGHVILYFDSEGRLVKRIEGQ
jgi:hypothetical protein